MRVSVWCVDIFSITSHGLITMREQGECLTNIPFGERDLHRCTSKASPPTEAWVEQEGEVLHTLQVECERAFAQELLHTLHGYLTYKKTCLRRTLPYAYA